MMGPVRELGRRKAALAWYGALGGIGAWIAHFFATYWWAEGGCDNAAATPPSIEPVVIGLTILLGALAVLSGVAAALTYRDSNRGQLFDPRDRVAFMGAAGTIAAIVFSFAIVLEGIQVLLLDGCAPS